MSSTPSPTAFRGVNEDWDMSWAHEALSQSDLRYRIEELRRMKGPPSSERKAQSQSAVKKDDLRWLLDKEDHAAASASEGIKAELRGAEERVANLRVMYGALRNVTLRRTKKMDVLERELSLLFEQCADSPKERAQDAARLRKLAETKARFDEMERLAEHEAEYARVLDAMADRLADNKGGREDEIASLRGEIDRLEVRCSRSKIDSTETRNSARQMKNAVALQQQLNTGQALSRHKMAYTRKKIIAKTKDVSAEQAEQIQQQAEALTQRDKDEEEDEEKLATVRLLAAQKVANRLRKLEEQFRRVQQLMGFVDLDAVVERVIAQQAAGDRMAALREEAMARHERLIDEKARIDCLYEEQLGGVDSELNKRRHEYALPPSYYPPS